MLVTHTTINIFTDCDFPQGYNYAVAVYIITLIILFGNFYYKAYVVGKAKKRDSQISDDGNGGSGQINMDVRNRKRTFVRKTVHKLDNE